MSGEHKLCKSRDNKIIAGVCGGLAKYFDIDSAIVRLGFILLTFATYAAMAVVYCLMWILLPNEEVKVQNVSGNSDSGRYRDYTYKANPTNYSNYENSNEKAKENEDKKTKDYSNMNEEEMDKDKSSSSLGIILIVIGFVLFFRNMIPHHLLNNYIFPVVLLICGIVLIFAAGIKSKREEDYYYDDNLNSDEQAVKEEVSEYKNEKEEQSSVIVTPIYEEETSVNEEKEEDLENKDVQIEAMEEFHFEDNNEDEEPVSDVIILPLESDNNADTDIKDDEETSDDDKSNVIKNLDNIKKEDTPF